MKITYFTSESVTKGHPDKVCDQISDAILDALLREDPDSRCACETIAYPKGVFMMGEITTRAKIDYKAVARKTIRDIGYTKDEYDFNDKCDISYSFREQQRDIAEAVNHALDDMDEYGAGDQGIMFGYASKEGDEYMPLALDYARRLTKKLTSERESESIGYLRPDGKSQVTIEYHDHKPARIDTIVLSAQHDPDIPIERIKEDLLNKVIKGVLPNRMIDRYTKILINPSGSFVEGGPIADTGLTGRKIIVDTYGGYARHGGGSFSGKDPTKVDRTAAYALRNIAKTIVASNAADEAEVQVAYSIGISEPVSIHVKTFGTGLVSDEDLISWIMRHWDLRPSEMIKRFDLKRPIFEETAREGHFGNASYPWEKIDKDALGDLKSLF